jgi:pimeloyl-ACP methyl ester carboxylesterase
VVDDGDPRPPSQRRILNRRPPAPIAAEFGPAYSEALGGDVGLEVYDEAGHWLWLDRPGVVDRVAAFVTAR